MNNETSALQAKMLQFAKLHSMQAHPGFYGSIFLDVPWTNARLNQTGVDTMQCDTFAELRETLGY